MAISIRVGNAVALLRAMPSDSVHCVVTSPPYWGLRDYGTPPQIWGGSADCRHQWGSERLIKRSGGTAKSTLGAAHWGNSVFADGIEAKVKRRSINASQGAFCARCGAWRGSLGLEPTYQLYVDHLVEVLREVRRVLRPDGTLWLNLGDCYATGGGKAKRAGGGGQGDRWEKYGPRGYQGIGEAGFQPNRMPQPGLKPKDLVGIPWRVAFALQDEGWWLRRDQIWHKPNPMPESTTDRCTSGHEYLFHLAKSGRYYFDHHAIKEPFADGRMGCDGGTAGRQRNRGGRSDGFTKPSGIDASGNGGRHKRSVWTITAAPYAEAHFATFPPALVEPCILAGTSERGVCSHCGAPWRRLVKRAAAPKQQTNRQRHLTAVQVSRTGGTKTGGTNSTTFGLAAAEMPRSETIGWRATCDCPGTDAVPPIVLDPFLGSGTTALVADRLGRDCIGLELSRSYAAMAERRTGSDAPRLRRAA